MQPDNNSTQPSNENNTQPVTTSTESAAQHQPVYSPDQPNSSKKKKLIIAVIALVVAVIAIGGGVGAYFGIYLPAQPDKLWEMSLSNTADAYDKLAESQNSRDQKSGGTFKGNFKLETKDLVADGNIDAKFDSKDAEIKIDAGASGTRFTLDLLAIDSPNSSYPDIYAKASGLSGVNSLLQDENMSGLGNSLAAIDNKWYTIDHTFLDAQLKTVGGSTALEYSKEDVKALTDAVGKVNREYIFTTNPDKAVITKTENIGKEKYDDRDAYSYKVRFKKDKLKEYVTALESEIKKTKFKDALTEDDVKSIKESIDKLDDTKQADAWVDIDTKLIRNVRFVTNEANKEYLDVGQKYNGGNEIPFHLGFTSEDDKNAGKANILITANMDNDNLKIDASLDAKENNEVISGTFNGQFTASNDDVNPQKPADAKTILELYQIMTSGFMGMQQGTVTPGTSEL